MNWPLIASVWGVCALAAALLWRHDLKEERRTAALRDAKKRKSSSTREERPAGATAPPAPVFDVDHELRYTLALLAVLETENADRLPCSAFPDEVVAVSRAMMGEVMSVRAMMGEGGPRR